MSIQSLADAELVGTTLPDQVHTGEAADIQPGRAATQVTIRALLITYTILGAPYYKYGIMGPNTLF